ncbi:LADA_0D01068g1_1 [Lachancea dasiensis]|uniref:LADA_0D01068g1_1 n=1 Tax=Lachancea dasiensis TaxID=1072105 RepID=A0A1G4J3S1_9SACH|nr:LADA_0D01068g1_1 [Lachancea dasiensis]
MSRANEDPRHAYSLDLYEVVTSEEDDDFKIQNQLEKLEQQRKDLEERLRSKAERRKNLSRLQNHQVEIPASPRKGRNEKQAVANLSKSKDESPADRLEEAELIVHNKGPDLAHSTSYFVEKFANVRKTAEQKVQRRNDLMNCRVHTFRGLEDAKLKEPLVVDEKEPFSGMWLTRRYLPEIDLNQIFKDVKILRLPKLFSKVRPPKFSEPDYANWVAVGIISAKSAVKMTSAQRPSKYFKFTLTDFQHNLDTYVFGNKNVEKYYNLRLGDVVAVLNPDILPWRPSQVNDDEFSGAVVKSFNLSIRNEFDCLLEIGASKSLAFCSAYNKSTGKVCGVPINSAITDRCEYHQEVRFRQINAQRVELNGSTPMRSPTKNGKKQALYGRAAAKRKFELLPDKHAPKSQDRETSNTLYFSNPNYARAFFDDSYQNPDLLNNLEGKRRKFKETEKEKLLRKQLDKAVGKTEVEGFKDKNAQEQKHMWQTTEQALNSGLVKSIGFDPTRGKMRGFLADNRNSNQAIDNRSSQVKELMKMKKTNIDLAPSKADNMKRLQRREKIWREHFREVNNRNTEDLSSNVAEKSDSESELEIV